MRIKPEFSIRYYDMDDICIVRTDADGTAREVSPISASAAMAWDGFQKGLSREAIIQSIVLEFTGVTEETAAQELEELARRLVALGYAEE